MATKALRIGNPASSVTFPLTFPDVGVRVLCSWGAAQAAGTVIPTTNVKTMAKTDLNMDLLWNQGAQKFNVVHLSFRTTAAVMRRPRHRKCIPRDSG
jgi:hypothetical protein